MRPTTWAALALGLLVGMGGQLQQASLHGPPWLAWGAASLAWGGAGLWCLWCHGARRAPRSRPPGMAVVLVAAGAVAAGWAWAETRAAARLAHVLDSRLEQVDVHLVGIVAGLPTRRGDGVRFLFDVEEARGAQGPVRVPRFIQMGWIRGEAVMAPAGALAVVPGERWALTARLRRPHGTINPAGFDQELAWFERGVGATGSVREVAVVVGPRRLAQGQGHVIDRARHAVREAIVLRLGDVPAAGLLAALSVGDQAAIGRADWDVFRTTGIAHLVAISGLHVTMFAWLAGQLVLRGWRRSGVLALTLPAPLAARWAGGLAAVAYAVLAGWGVPAQRTVLMLLLAGVARTAGVRWPWGWLVGGAAVAVCVADPWALLQPGFWLSFVAVAVLMADGRVRPMPAQRPAALPAAARLLAGLRGAVRTQWLVGMVLAPLSLMFFHQVSVVGFVANLLAIPLVTLVITPLALLGVALPSLWSLAAGVVDLGMAGLAGLAHWPGAQWQAAAAPTWALALAVLAVAVMAAPLPRLVRLAGVLMTIPLFAPPVPRPAPGEIDLLVADVGQGTAVLVRTATRAMLVDAGPSFGVDSDAGVQVLVPLLRAVGVPALDLLMLSHRDSDHVGGAVSVLGAVPTARVTSSLEPGHPLRLVRPHQPCQAGQRWSWDGVRFEVLHPWDIDVAAGGRPNARSCVVKVSTSRTAVLLTGDIERAQEAALVAAGTSLAADVLVVPHHGSRTSSSPDFLRAVRPRWAVIQAGYLNRYGHPTADVLARHARLGIEVVRTDHCGAWRWSSGSAEATCQRALDQRYWHWQDESHASRLDMPRATW